MQQIAGAGQTRARTLAQLDALDDHALQHKRGHRQAADLRTGQQHLDRHRSSRQLDPQQQQVTLGPRQLGRGQPRTEIRLEQQ